MERYDIYRDIATRCDGTVFIGVVGPVRTGKSTLIAQMMEQMVLPNLPESYRKERMVDEVPQSGSGKSIMTTQPRFVPAEPVSLDMEGVGDLSVRFVDCVGYMVEGALGADEEGTQRMVRTPWFEKEIPFAQAAEVGTDKVIGEHSTIGILVTTDGSFSGIDRLGYVEAEEKAVSALKRSGKPFVLVLNSATPDSPEARRLAEDLTEKYDVPALLLDVLHLTQEDLASLLRTVLYEFPLREVIVDLPTWVQALPEDEDLPQAILSAVQQSGQDLAHVRDIDRMIGRFEMEDARAPFVEDMDLGTGRITLGLPLREGLFYEVLSRRCGEEIRSDAHLMAMMTDLVAAKREYDRVADALESVKTTGYGLVAPAMEELTLAEPEITRHGGSYGVRLKASAPSLHMIRVDIATEVNPILGSEKESEDMVHYLLSEFENNPAKLWSTNIFGKSLHDLVREGLAGKLMRMPEDAQQKTRETLSRIINEGSGGMICILL